ncbi:PspA/IM30 family protein [Amphibacillus cookii]|uniref:PspA/IM30 family protein n=1 Tax=Amphibacillus cookii TaxID=767787 RepID=UPI0019565A80|nr:PspA/IM30 family protein [Amphibacillus cookii]MBM7541067.1 phage shock protein A [Amphibacillus cookii]
MSILARFQDIISSNINAVLDRMENPEKMIDQYLRNMMKDLAEVKENTASVMAEETKAKRQVDDNDAEVKKYTELTKKALTAGNEADARVFLKKKQELEDIGVGLAKTYATAHENASKMRQMHDKLASDIEKLKGRRAMLKAQISVANTQEKLNDMTKSAGKAQGAMSSFQRMEEKVTQQLDEANAMASLNEKPVDEAKSLEEKYALDQSSAAVEDELERLKGEMGL